MEAVRNQRFAVSSKGIDSPQHSLRCALLRSTQFTRSFKSIKPPLSRFPEADTSSNINSITYSFPLLCANTIIHFTWQILVPLLAGVGLVLACSPAPLARHPPGVRIGDLPIDVSVPVAENVSWERAIVILQRARYREPIIMMNTTTTTTTDTIDSSLETVTAVVLAGDVAWVLAGTYCFLLGIGCITLNFKRLCRRYYCYCCSYTRRIGSE